MRWHDNTASFWIWLGRFRPTPTKWAESTWRSRIDDVCAVLQAIREPSEAMTTKMREDLPLVDDPQHVSDAEFTDYWQATIDAALEEGE